MVYVKMSFGEVLPFDIDKQKWYNYNAKVKWRK